jgi:hypothetical protein
MTKSQPSLAHVVNITKSQPSLTYLNLARLATYVGQPGPPNLG